MKVTRGIQRNFGVSMHRRHHWQKSTSARIKTSSYDPVNPEHEATSWVSWVDYIICKSMSIFSAQGL
jgi:hypothetical protein